MPRGTVTKIEMEPVIRCLWLARKGEDWGWTTVRLKAYVFPTFELAEEAVARLRAGGKEPHVHAVVYGTDAERADAERAAHEDTIKRETGARKTQAEQENHQRHLQRHRQMLEAMHLD